MTREEFLAQLPELVKSYRPSSEVLQKLRQLTLLIVIGPSGVGKSTVIKELGLPYVPSDTTRPKRSEEIEGRDYFFRHDFERLEKEIRQGHFVQIAVGSGSDFYGTRASSYPEKGLATMAVVADVVPIFRELGFGRTLSIFIAPPNFTEWMRRMDAHPMSEEQRAKRLTEAKRSFSFALNDPDVHFIYCENPPAAAAQINRLVAGQTDKSREELGRRAANDCLDRLN